MRTILSAMALVLCLSANSYGQGRTFTKESLDYTLDLPSQLWRAVARMDVHDHMEFVNGSEHGNGYLRLRKRFVSAKTTGQDLFRYDEQWELRRLPGYVVCSNGESADFSGRLKGIAFSYQFVNGGVNMDGRIYYLQVDNRTFYTLHFTVASEKLADLREQMDSIARSFRLK